MFGSFDIPCEEINFGFITSFSDALLDSWGALLTDLRVATFEVFAVLRVLSFIFIVFGMILVWEILGKTCSEEVLILDTDFAEQVVVDGWWCR